MEGVCDTRECCWAVTKAGHNAVAIVEETDYETPLGLKL